MRAIADHSWVGDFHGESALWITVVGVALMLGGVVGALVAGMSGANLIEAGDGLSIILAP
jgi:hypothetical protein